MALSREAYRALEDIVGPDNISEEPAVLDSYAWMHGNEVRSSERTGFSPVRPEAAIMPGSTAEVQAIVKACNRYGIKIKPFSTGWVMTAQVIGRGAINMDLRRMNRILEIDERNMVAVIEPYVVGAQLQAELMKRGLNCHLIGAGAGCSPLASATAGVGNGADSLYMGYSAEVLLGTEWIMPDGNILRTGSLGSGQGWYCGEGPGPSLRGLFRGKAGTRGALGVFTRCAVKLAPWPGPASLPVEGTIPAYYSPLPDNFRTYTLVLPSWKALADAFYKIYDAEIGYAAHHQFNKLGEDLAAAFYTMYTDPTKSLDDLEEIVNRPEIRKLTDEMRHFSFQFILAGMSPRDIEYQEKVLDKILEETGGHKVAAMSGPMMADFTALYILRFPAKHLNYVYAGGKTQYFRPDGTPDFAVNNAQPMIDILAKHQAKGRLPKTGGDTLMSAVSGIGGGGDFHFEQFVQYDRNSIESMNAAIECSRDAAAAGLPVTPEPVQTAGLTREQVQEALRNLPQPARFHWQWKIKQIVDPNGTGDLNYTTLEKPPPETP